ncbi:MAG: hypothetical protein ACK4YO_03220 [Candidatus Altarchaeaceae archaeon]
MKTTNAIKVRYDERKLEILTLIGMYREVKRSYLQYLWKMCNPVNKSDFLSIIRRYKKNGLIGEKNRELIPARTGKGRQKIECIYYLTDKGKKRLEYLIKKYKNGTNIL